MTPPRSSWPPWLQPWRETHHSTEIEGRITRLEVFQEQQEDTNKEVESRMAWLERGLQAVAVILLIVLSKLAPSSAGALADVLLAIIKR